MHAEARNIVYIIDATGCSAESYPNSSSDNSRACKLGSLLLHTVAMVREGGLQVQPIFFCKDIVKHNERWNEFKSRVGFVFLHRNNRQIVAPGSPGLNEDPASYDEIIRFCEKHCIPLVQYTGDYFWSETATPVGFDKKLMLESNALLVSYGQFLEHSAHMLIELWQRNRWSVQNASRLIDQIVHRNIRNPLLALAGCDLLAQGYLLIWNAAQLRNSACCDQAAIDKARKATLPPKLTLRAPLEASKESFWFDDCKNELETAFSPETDTKLQSLIECFCPPYSPQKWLVRCLHSSHSRMAGTIWWHLPNNEKPNNPGALRLLVELIKGNDKTFLEDAGWPNGFETEHSFTDTQSAILELMSSAHNEFIRAWHDLESLSRSDRNSFESIRNELHHDKLKNEFLFTVAYDPDDVGNGTRDEIMLGVMKRDEKSLRLLKRGAELWGNLSPVLTDFFDSLPSRYGFITTEEYQKSQQEMRRAISSVDAIVEKVESDEFNETDIQKFWKAVDRISELLSNMAISRRFSDYVMDVDSRLIKETQSV
jgi:hypothetical protein